MTHLALSLALIASVTASAAIRGAQSQPSQPVAADTPVDYVIGPQDVLGIVFWREPDLSGDVTVRPDGKISLPVIGTVTAEGLRPEELQAEILKLATKFITDPNVAVVIRTINSRRIFVTGQVKAPGAHPIVGPLTVMQALALAGGITDFADAKNITIIRVGGSGPSPLKFNYKDVSKGRKMEQNILLRPGDTVVVP